MKKKKHAPKRISIKRKIVCAIVSNIRATIKMPFNVYYYFFSITFWNLRQKYKDEKKKIELKNLPGVSIPLDENWAYSLM